MSHDVNPLAFEYRDMFGREIKVGDYIVYGGLADRSAVLRAGRVIELKCTKDWSGKLSPKVKAESWNNYRSMGYGGIEKSGKQKAVSLGFLDRIVVVPESYVSDKVKRDLDGPVD